MRFSTDTWADSLEAGCETCFLPFDDDGCDCLRCAECRETIAREGRDEFARRTPAVVCCSTRCLLDHGSRRILRNCITVLTKESPDVRQA